MMIINPYWFAVDPGDGYVLLWEELFPNLDDYTPDPDPGAMAFFSLDGTELEVGAAYSGAHIIARTIPEVVGVTKIEFDMRIENDVNIDDACSIYFYNNGVLVAGVVPRRELAYDASGRMWAILVNTMTPNIGTALVRTHYLHVVMTIADGEDVSTVHVTDLENADAVLVDHAPLNGDADGSLTIDELRFNIDSSAGGSIPMRYRNIKLYGNAP